jgi:hypothetical protein
MLASLMDEESIYLTEVLCRLLGIGIARRRSGTDAELYSALSELHELLISLDGDAYVETDIVLNAIFEFPDIEETFYAECEPLLSSSSTTEFATALNNIYNRAEHLLEFVNEHQSAHVYYMAIY